MAKLHISGNRGHWWQNLKDSDTASKYWQQPNARVTTSHCACRWRSMCLGTLQHQDADPIKINLKSIQKTSFDFSGLWIRTVTGLYLSPKCCLYFLFSSFQSSSFFWRRTSPKARCIPQGLHRGNKTAPLLKAATSFAKPQSEFETVGNCVQRQREQIKIQNKQHFSGFVG